MNCNFIFPECYWQSFEDHKATHLFDTGEPIPVAQRKRKAKHEETDKVKVTKKNQQLSGPSDPGIMIIPTEKAQITTEFSGNTRDWRTVDNFNPLGLNPDDFMNEPCDSQQSEWEREPEDGFLVLLEEEQVQLIDAKLTPMTWRLYKVDIPVPSAPRTTGLSDDQCCLDPRLS